MKKLHEKTGEERIKDADEYAVKQLEEELRGDRDVADPFKKKKKKKRFGLEHFLEDYIRIKKEADRYRTI